MKTFGALLCAIVVFAALDTYATANSVQAKKKERDVASAVKTARRISCGFTEPFYGIELDIKRKRMKISSMGSIMDDKVFSNRIDEIDDLEIKQDKSGVWSVSHVNDPSVHGSSKPVVKTLILTIDPKQKGSDGMSDRVYDADAKAEVFMKSHIGGCDFLQ